MDQAMNASLRSVLTPMPTRVSFADVLRGVAPIISEPSRDTLSLFGVRVLVLPAFTPAVHHPTLEDCARYGAGVAPRADAPLPRADVEPWALVVGDAYEWIEWSAPEPGFREVSLAERMRLDPWAFRFNPRYLHHEPIIRVRDDRESAVPDDTVKELVAFAKAGNREDFDFLAGACGVEDREALWTGTRTRLNLTLKDAASAPSEAR